MKMLRNNIGVLTERGGTIEWMVDNSGMAVVDMPLPAQAEHLIEELKKKTDKKLNLLVNTHHHGDHSAGNIALRGMVGNVITHENTMLSQKRVAESRDTLDTQLLLQLHAKKGRSVKK